MTLVMRTAKGAVAFECSDEDAETVVKIEPTDTDEVMLRKLKRVIALVEGEQAALPPGVPEYGVMNFGLAAAAIKGTPPAQPTNGWAAYAEPKVPEHLAGEIEVIKPGEEA